MPSFRPLYNLFLSFSSKGDWTYQNHPTQSSLFLIEIDNILQSDTERLWLNSYLQIREYYPVLEGRQAVEGKLLNVFPSLETKNFMVEIPYVMPSLSRYLQARYLPKRSKKFKASLNQTLLGKYAIEGRTELPYFNLDRFDVKIYEWR